MSAFVSMFTSVLLAATGAGGLVATDVIRSGDIVRADNAEAKDGALTEIDQSLIGREVVRTVYPGRDIVASNTRAPRLVTRNQIVQVKYVKNGLEISLSGRAMSEGGVGDQVSVMNTNSRKMISGVVTPEGWVHAQ